MHNETDHQMKQISTALLETEVRQADPESSRWSAASRETSPSWGHLFSSDPEACRRDDPLQQHKASHSVCSPPRHLGCRSASQRLMHQLLAALVRTSSGPFLLLVKLSLRCASPLLPQPTQSVIPACAAGIWTLEHGAH